MREFFFCSIIKLPSPITKHKIYHFDNSYTYLRFKKNNFLYSNAIFIVSLLCFLNRCHSSSKLDSSSYEERKISKEFEELTLDELEVIATLGMGGFGRVELVIAFPHVFSLFFWRDLKLSKSLQNRLVKISLRKSCPPCDSQTGRIYRFFLRINIWHV